MRTLSARPALFASALTLTLLGPLTIGAAPQAPTPAPTPKAKTTPKPAPTPATGPDRADMVMFMSGDYTIVGKKPDSQATYTGKLRFTAHGEKLGFTRTVGGHTTRGTAVFDTVAGGDRIPVLRLNFHQFGRDYAGTYQWSSDYDNYVRFPGYVYRPDTKAAGLEMLFPVPPSVRN